MPPPACHAPSLPGRQTKALETGRVQQHIGGVQQQVPIAVGHSTEEPHSVSIICR